MEITIIHSKKPLSDITDHIRFNRLIRTKITLQ